MSTPSDTDVINAALEIWGEYVLTVLAEKIRQRKVVLSGELLNSLQYQVLAATADSTGRLYLAFSESGRIKDMRGITRRKMAPISEIEDFVRKVGLSKFKRVPGTKGGKPITESQAVNRIAWGIARSQRIQQKHKPKKWFAKPFYGTINRLIDHLLDGYGTVAMGAITDEIKGGKIHG
jgi:hypothetical protein